MGWPSLWPAYDALALAVVPEQLALIVSQLVHLGSSLTVQLRWSTYSNIRRMTVNFAKLPELLRQHAIWNDYRSVFGFHSRASFCASAI